MSDGEVIILIDGKVELKQWSEYSLDSDFLTPADAFSVGFGTDQEWDRVRGVVKPDARCTVTVDGALQCTGWIDSVSAGSSSSTSVTIAGRDILRPLVDANVHPDTPFKDVTIADLVATVIKQVYRTNVPDLFYDNEANRKLLSGTAIPGVSKNTTGAQKRIDYVRPQANEGAFDFVARNLRRFGLWLWGTADGNIVISSPCYSQEPAYTLTRRRGGKIVQVLDATYTLDRTNVPSHIFVRGKAGGKEFSKKTARGSAFDVDWKVWRPMYVVHDNATSDAEAMAFAVQEMSDKMRNAEVYECTCRGHTDPVSGKVYAIDTVALVQDEFHDVFRPMWVCGRTFRRTSRGETTTRLKLLPLGAIKFSDVDAP